MKQDQNPIKKKPKPKASKSKGKKKPKGQKAPVQSKPDQLIDDVIGSENPRGQGRPTLYTEAIANEICERLAAGETLRTICKSEHMPHESTVRWWVVSDKEGFSTHYTRARDLGLDAIAEELFDIADDGTNDWMTVGRAGAEIQVENREVTNRSKLRCETRKWYLSKLAPKRYGEKVEHNFGNPLQVKTIRDDIPDSPEGTGGEG